MSEAKDNEELGQDSFEGSDYEMAEKEGNEMSENHIESGQGSELFGETRFGDGVVAVEPFPEPDLEEETHDSDGMLENDYGNVGDVVDGTSELKEEKENGLVNVRRENGVERMEMKGEGNVGKVHSEENCTEETPLKQETSHAVQAEGLNQSFALQYAEGEESGTEEEQAAFMRELDSFFKERSMEFKPPKFYGEGLNCLKLWRAVTRLGGYDQVTSCKLWRQVGESFKPPKTCTTVSWSFRCFYEKALLDYERHKIHGGELPAHATPLTEPMGVNSQTGGNQASGSGRARRDAAARAMQGWHSQRLLGNGEVGDPIIKDKSSVSLPKREKQLKNLGVSKRKKPSSLERAVKVARNKGAKPHDGPIVFAPPRLDRMESTVMDVGPIADWVKINVRRTKDCFEIYALVPGLLREEVRVQSDPTGRVVVSGEPEDPDNPWGVTPFKKVITLPSRIDPHQTSAVVTLHGQLFIRAPFEQPKL